MLTTCPECRSKFRLSHEQLEVKHGLVRCGYCRAVFNAYDTLLPEFEPPSPPPLVPDVPEESPTPAWAEPEPEAEQIEIGIPAGYDDGPLTIPDPDAVRVGGQTEEDDAFVLHMSEREAVDEKDVAGASAVTKAVEDPEAVLLSELPTRSQIEPESGSRILPLLLGFALTLILLAQGAYFLRGWLVEQAPGLRPAFEVACAPLGCTIPLSADIAAIRVESSSLETDPEQASRATLRASFSNRSKIAQQWPHFVLKLTDWKGETLAQRVFPPAAYLAKGGIAPAGMAPGDEHEFRLELDLSGLNAAGYEVLPKYP
jgi:predicted Zn finger-like uncharacterized protein